MPDPMVLARLPAMRAAPSVSSWAARSFVRTVEDATYDQSDLVEARALARSGRLGAVVVLAGMASVRGPAIAGEQLLAQVRVAAMPGWDAFVAETAREAGHLAALEVGRLPDELLESAEEAGAEPVPSSGELETACTCTSWVQPCRHSLALLLQLAWHLEVDPYVLLLLRGHTREWLLEEVTTLTRGAAEARRLLRETEDE